jgi:hypothetical protein
MAASWAVNAFAEITERMELARHGAHTFWAC